MSCRVDFFLDTFPLVLTDRGGRVILWVDVFFSYLCDPNISDYSFFIPYPCIGR